MIRPATLADRAAIIGLIEPWTELYPLKRDPKRMFSVLTEAISSARHFVWVAESRGLVGGVLIGLSSDNLWAQRMNCNVVTWISDIPGEGVRLLRKFTDFVKSRSGIKVAGFAPDADVDPRVWKLVERMGYERSGCTYLLYT